MKTAKFLFWVGIVLMVVEPIFNLYGFAFRPTFNWVNLGVIFGGLFQGGLVIGVSKILEALLTRKA